MPVESVMVSAEKVAGVKQTIMALKPPELWPEEGKAALLSWLELNPTMIIIFCDLEPSMFKTIARRTIVGLRSPGGKLTLCPVFDQGSCWDFSGTSGRAFVNVVANPCVVEQLVQLQLLSLSSAF